MSKARTFHFLPFSHVPATTCIVPGSTLVCRVYPALVEVFDYGDARCLLVQAIELSSIGPLEQFTVIQNLEKGYVQVSGFAKQGYICYQLYAAKNSNTLGVKVLKGSLDIAKEQERILLKKQGRFQERLHLGCYKKQRFPDVLYRAEVSEFLPLCYLLAQSLPAVLGTLFTGKSLCTQLQEAVANKEEVLFALENLFKAGFTSLLLPRLVDTDHQGFSLPLADNPNQSPLLLLQETYPLIRKLFFDKEEVNSFSCPL